MSKVEVTQPAEGVTQLTLNRPERLNTLNRSLVADLTAAHKQVAGDAECRVVVLTGAGRSFCAGLDLKSYADAGQVAAQGRVGRQLTRQREMAALTQHLFRLPQPVISAINGPIAGAGLALACASDIRIAATDTLFAVGFIRVGHSACDVGLSWLLPRIVGAGRAHELMLTGRRFRADEALRIGLVTDVVDPDALLDAALAKAAEIQLNAPLSVELTKQGMWLALETPSFDVSVAFENSQQVSIAFTDDYDEARLAFLEKRPPRYRRR